MAQRGLVSLLACAVLFALNQELSAASPSLIVNSEAFPSTELRDIEVIIEEEPLTGNGWSFSGPGADPAPRAARGRL